MPRELVMQHYWFKECPRCQGDLREEGDMYGTYVSCMQCGYTLKAHEERALAAQGTLKNLAPESNEEVAA